MYSPPIDFDFTTGQATSGEGYKFQFVWNIFDYDTVSPPPDFERIGEVTLKLKSSFYDSALNSIVSNSIDLKYHTCTSDDRSNLGELF